jgi:hypothetical protein
VNNPAAPISPQPFDAKAAQRAITTAMLNFVKLTFRAPGPPAAADLEAGQALMAAVPEALKAGSEACGELDRIRGDLAAARDEHRPRPHADPSAAGAQCTRCSLSGVIVSWPCEPWNLAERILNRGRS